MKKNLPLEIMNILGEKRNTNLLTIEQDWVNRIRLYLNPGMKINDSDLEDLKKFLAIIDEQGLSFPAYMKDEAGITKNWFTNLMQSLMLMDMKTIDTLFPGQKWFDDAIAADDDYDDDEYDIDDDDYEQPRNFD